MSEKALKIIAENKKTKGKVLDLGNCGLTEVPPEALECVWVEELILGNNWTSVLAPFLSTYIFNVNFSQNNGKANKITFLPDSLSKLEYLTKIVFNENNIFDLSPLMELANLQEIHCKSNNISDLSPLKKLFNLQVLNIGSNQIVDLYYISQLTKLQVLFCFSNHISDLSPIGRFFNLKNLSFSRNKVVDLSPLVGLNEIEALNCNSNNIDDFSFLSSLGKLSNLSISDCQLSDLWVVNELLSIEWLNCSNNHIKDLHPIVELKNLIGLDCSYNQIKSVAPLKFLDKIHRLDCSFNQISDLSPLTQLNHLYGFNCANNKITDLTPILPFIKKGVLVWWSQYFDDDAICLENCPLIIPPVEFAQAGNEAVLEYFDQLGDDRTPLNEIKVIFLGDGASGKTSLVKRIRGEEFDIKESQTHGIRIRKTPFEVGEETIHANVWDFGGQEVMHATHQFFLSRRCVYVLVLNSRTDEKAEYWLKHASSFGGDSPVLVALNKIDENPGYDVNRKQLKEKYPQIVDFFKISCKENKGVAEFRAALTEQIARSDTRRTPFPSAWAAVKDHFTGMTVDYIESSVYREFCRNNGVEKAFSQDVLLQFLHDLGVTIHFRHLKNFDTQILNPLWLTNGVYRIVNSPLVAQNNGLLLEDELDAVINDPRYNTSNTQERPFHYPPGKLTYIARVMEEFELSFRLDADAWVVPQLLPVEEPDFIMEGQVLHFVLRFPEFLPDSIFPRLMVKLNPYIKESLRWRTGMVLFKPIVFNAHARIRADREDKEIRIDVCGKEPRRLLSFIRETVREIAAGFTNLNYLEMAPIPDTKEEMEYQYLLEAEKAGQKEVFVRGKGSVAISDLLNGIEEPVMRDKLSQIPVSVFISYSHEDDDYRKKLRSALAPLERLNKLKIWDDREINAGSEWEQEIFREMAAADIVLCLISADFIQSEFCYSKELKAAMGGRRQGEKAVVPIRLRECLWEKLPIAKLQATPGSEWIASCKDIDRVLTEVARHLEPLVEAAKVRKEKQHKNER